MRGRQPEVRALGKLGQPHWLTDRFRDGQSRGKLGYSTRDIGALRDKGVV